MKFFRTEEMICLVKFTVGVSEDVLNESLVLDVEKIFPENRKKHIDVMDCGILAGNLAILEVDPNEYVTWACHGSFTVHTDGSMIDGLKYSKFKSGCGF